MPTTPGGTAYTVTAFTSSAGEPAWRAIADSQVAAASVPMVLFCHGNPGAVTTDADTQFQLSAYAPVRNWLIDNGWAWVEGRGAGANWGNAAGRAAYEAMFTDAKAVWSIGRVVVIGRSMGALVGAWLAALSPVVAPWCAGFVSLSGTADLTNRYASAGTTDRTNMNAAYGVTDDTSWRAAVGPYDPLLASIPAWSTRDAQMQWDTSDTTVPYAANGQAWDTRFGPVLDLRRVITTSGGDHNTTPNDATHQAATITFLQDAARSGGRWPVAWSDGWANDVESVTRTASGGVVLSGTAPAVASVAATGAGGVTVWGSAPQVVSVARGASGGVVLSGVAEVAVRVVTTADGGLQLGGSGAASVAVSTTAAGGVVIGGDAATGGSTSRTASGGVVLGGSAEAVVRVSTTAAGGVSVGGSAELAGAVAVSAAGGLTLGGSVVSSVRVSSTAVGGPVLGGSASQSVTLPPAEEFAASGGLTIGGAADAVVRVVVVASGGVSLGGSAAVGAEDVPVPWIGQLVGSRAVGGLIGSSGRGSLIGG